MTFIPRWVFPSFAVWFVFAGAGGCSSVPETLREQGIEKISQIPPDARAKIQTSLKKSVEVINAPDIHRYLSSIAKKLIATDGKSITPTIKLVRAKDGPPSKPKLWIVPPELGYVDERILKSIQFENEIAAIIAFNWERAQDGAFESRFITELDQPLPDFRNIYEFTEMEDLKAVEATIDRLYHAGYDPRGLITVFDRKTGTDKERIPLLQDKARRTISFYKPLLNPIVRSNEFYQIKKKLEKL